MSEISEDAGPTLGDAYWRGYTDKAGIMNYPYTDLDDETRRAVEAGAAAAGAAAIARLNRPAERAAALAEARELRKIISEFIGMFRGISGGWGARTSGGRIDRLARAAGVPGLSPGQPGEPDELAAVTAERDELRKLLDEIGVTAANAPEDGDSFGLLEQIAMRIAAAGVPDRLSHLEGR